MHFHSYHWPCHAERSEASESPTTGRCFAALSMTEPDLIVNNHHPYRLIQVHDCEQWDSFVAAHPSGHLLQSWGWGELKASVGWHPLRLALWDTRQERIVAAAQVLRRAPAHIPPRLGHLAYIPKGPVLDWSAETPYEQEEPLPHVFLTQLLAVLRDKGAIAVRLELPQAVGAQFIAPSYPRDTGRNQGSGRNQGASGQDGGRNQGASGQDGGRNQGTDGDQGAMNCAPTTLGFRPVRPVQPSRTILLDLAQAEDALLAGMKEKWRYNVRLAARRGVVVRLAQSCEDVQAWYRILQVTGQRDGFGIHTLDYYQRAWQLLAPRNQAQLFLAEHDGRLLAGIFVGLMARQAIYLYGASSNEQRQLMPNYLLQWEAIRWAKSQGTRVYDFWGIPDSDNPDEAMAGVYRFKSGWGGQIVSFAGSYEYICRPAIMRLARRFMR
jgi:peptidoglycan pentaglycine glycine transferase (the first glycine)